MAGRPMWICAWLAGCSRRTVLPAAGCGAGGRVAAAPLGRPAAIASAIRSASPRLMSPTSVMLALAAV